MNGSAHNSTVSKLLHADGVDITYLEFRALCLDLALLREELASLRLREKSNDLYQFRQSGELNRAAGPCLAALRETLLTQVKPILSKVAKYIFFY